VARRNLSWWFIHQESGLPLLSFDGMIQQCRRRSPD
jgi:hypothetical protein